MRGKKRMAVWAVIMAAAISLAACGKDKTNGGLGNASANAPETDYAYVPEYTPLGGGEFTSFQDVCFSGGSLYYVDVFFDVVNQRNDSVLKQYSLTEKRILRERDIHTELGDDRVRQMGRYCVLEDGSLYTVEQAYSYSGSARATLLCAYDPEWNLRWEQDITAVIKETGPNGYADSITADAEGRICLAVESTLCMFDSEGIHLGNAALDDVWIEGLWTAGDGRAYVRYHEQPDTGQMGCLAEIDFEKRALGESYPDLPDSRTVAADSEGNALISSYSCLSRYDFAAQRAEELFQWTDCGLNGGYVDAVGVDEDGGLLALYQDFEEGERFLVTLKRVDAASIPDKTQVTIGCLIDRYELQSAAAAFNRQSDSCQVTLMDYSQTEDGAQADAQDMVNAFGMALSTGIDCPDILVLDDMKAYQMDIGAIAGNGAFTDLGPFLDASALLKREDYLENALACYEYQGQLVGIPCEISLRTIAGRASELGQEPGWTLAELIDYASAHPEGQLFGGAVQGSVLQDCLTLGLDDFLDWDTGQCRFDSEDFRAFLTFAGTFPAEYDYQAESRSNPEMIQAGDVLLYQARINDFYGIQEHQAMFQGPVVYIGYPAAEGSGCIAECSGALAISAKSRNPEAAWEFVEYYLERASKWRASFPTRKAVLDRQMEAAVTVSYYLDEEGNPLLDAGGNPVPKSLGGYAWSVGSESTMYRTATKEEVSCIKELIGAARPVSVAEGRIMDIIREEAQPFFLGQKSAEEAADIIQSRVQNYLDER